MAGEQNRVVITGWGAVSSVGETADATYEAMRRGERGIRNEREWLEELTAPAYLKRQKLRTHLAARAPEFDLLSDSAIAAKEGFDRAYVDRYLSRSAVLAHKAAAEALRHAGIVTENLEISEVEPERLAFVIGTGIGGGIEIGEFRAMMEAGERLPATGMSKSQPENAAVTLALFYGAKGPSSTITGACAASNMAISDALRKLERNEAEVIVAGGTEGLDHQVIIQFERTRASNQDDDPAVASRPFHVEPGKAVLSEGAGLIVLESEEHAKRRGAKILGLIAGFGETNDAFDPTMLSGEQIVRAMRMALEQAEITWGHDLLLSAHATATPKGDEAERDAILKVFNDRDFGREQIWGGVSSIKGYTGHSVGAANGIQAVVSARALNEGEILPASWLENDNVLPGMEDLVPSNNTVASADIDAVLSNGMGFGGQNSSIVIRRYEEAA